MRAGGARALVGGVSPQGWSRADGLRPEQSWRLARRGAVAGRRVGERRIGGALLLGAALALGCTTEERDDALRRSTPSPGVGGAAGGVSSGGVAGSVAGSGGATAGGTGGAGTGGAGTGTGGTGTGGTGTGGTGGTGVAGTGGTGTGAFGGIGAGGTGTGAFGGIGAGGHPYVAGTGGMGGDVGTAAMGGVGSPGGVGGTGVPVCVPDEACNGLDDDCDGAIDEDDPGGGAVCTVINAAGVCAEGETSCILGTQVCVPANAPRDETCDGRDEDCDGQVDEGNPGSGLRCDTGVPGICSVGRTDCRGGARTCDPNTAPMPEVCNGVDDDCDGAVDDDCV